MITTPFKFGLFRFSSSSIAAKTYAKFQEKYSSNVAAFQKKITEDDRYSHNVKKSTQKIYQHPIDNFHRKISPGVMKRFELNVQFLGAEQVSPHYENFGMARREALVFWAGAFGMYFIATTPDIHFYARSFLLAWFFNWSYLYFFTEGKKSFAMPMLGRFYKKISEMQLNNLSNYYAENMEVRVRNLMNVAKSQIEYKLVHNDYLSVRNNILLNFFINEQVSLKNHLNERAMNILQQAEAYEEMNHNKIISGVMAETLNSIDKAYEENKQHIEKEIFKMALEGIANGRMDYSNDPILPFVIQTIQKTVQKFDKISPEEQNKLVKLTADQLESIRAADARARDEFLHNEPKIDGSLKNNEVVGKILENWGK